MAEVRAKILFLRAIRAHLSVYDSATMYRMDWTDDRLQERFDSIDHRFEEVDRRFDKVDRELGRVNDRLDGLQRSMVHGVIALSGSFIAGFAALIVLIATKL
jgi:hypothetical protein